jgi:hypothetical protein
VVQRSDRVRLHRPGSTSSGARTVWAWRRSRPVATALPRGPANESERVTVLGSNVQPKRRMRPRGAPWRCLCVGPSSLARLNRGYLNRCPDCGLQQYPTQTTAFRVEYGAGIPERVEFHCDCGYGIIVNDTPPNCPMCQANKWQRMAVGREAA